MINNLQNPLKLAIISRYVPSFKSVNFVHAKPKLRKCQKLKRFFGGQESVGRSIAMLPIFIFLERCLDSNQRAAEAHFLFASKFFGDSEI